MKLTEKIQNSQSACDWRNDENAYERQHNENIRNSHKNDKIDNMIVRNCTCNHFETFLECFPNVFSCSVCQIKRSFRKPS